MKWFAISFWLFINILNKYYYCSSFKYNHGKRLKNNNGREEKHLGTFFKRVRSWTVIFHQYAWVSKKERNQKKKAEEKQ